MCTSENVFFMAASEVFPLLIALHEGHANEFSFCDWLVTATSHKEVVFLRILSGASGKAGETRRNQMRDIVVASYLIPFRLKRYPRRTPD